MLLPSLTPFILLSTMFFCISLAATAIVLTTNHKLNTKDILYILLASIVFSFGSVVSRDYPNPASMFVLELAMWPYLLFFLWKLRGYTFKKSIILCFIATYIALISTHVSMVKLTLFSPSFNPIFAPGASTINTVTHLEIIHVLFFFPMFVSIALLVVRFTRGLRKIINQIPRLQTIFMYLCISIVVIFYTLLNVMRNRGYYIWPPARHNFSLDIFSIVVFTVFCLYVVLTNSRRERLRVEDERRTLIYYTGELERQQTAMRKFKHDYQNILLSLDSYIDAGDLDGLKQYYSSTVKAASGVITNGNFALEGLRRIKPQEIKSILATKLMMAQNMDINTIFEADQDIEYIPLDSTALVRKLGIILDNAIEALTELGSGELRVGCFKGESGVTFIVQNNCNLCMPPLHTLMQPGFSTKGKGRGLGLPNLTELVNSYPNVMLKTKVDDGSFTQRLSIDEEPS